MRMTIRQVKRMIREALAPGACPDCWGSGKEYVGFSGRDEGKPCVTCGGTGKETKAEPITGARKNSFMSAMFEYADHYLNDYDDSSEEHGLELNEFVREMAEDAGIERKALGDFMRNFEELLDNVQATLDNVVTYTNGKRTHERLAKQFDSKWGKFMDGSIDVVVQFPTADAVFMK